jgi:hypothetical protein
MRSAVLFLTAGAVVLLGPEWWVAASAAVAVLLPLSYHAKRRHSPYREGWY